MPSVTFNGTRGNYRVDYIETLDSANNRSIIQVTGVYFASTAVNGVYYADGAVWINGSQYLAINNNATGAGTYIGSLGTFELIANSTGTEKYINHSADGTGSFTIQLRSRSGSGYNDFNMFHQSSMSYNSFINQTKTVQMTPIQNASSLTAPNGTLGASINLVISRENPIFTHTIKYSCGSEIGTIVTKDARTVIAFTPPVSLASQNTTGSAVGITYTLETYNGNTLVGTTTTSATYTIPDSVKPEVSPGWATVDYYNTGSAAESIPAFVQNYSKAQVTFDTSKIDLSGDYGATIASYKVVLNGSEVTASPYRTGIITGSGTLQVSCYVYDTRGNYAKEDISITVLPYANPTMSEIEVFRCNDQGTPSSSGTYISIKAKAACSPLDGYNIVSLKANYKISSGSYGADIPLVSEQVSIIGDGDISTTSSYIVKLTATDSLGNVTTYEVTVPTDSIAFNIRVGGNGAAFGKYAEHFHVLELPDGWQLQIGSTTLSEAQLIALLNLI